MQFREAGPGDVQGVTALIESAYRGAPSRTGWTTEADLLDGQRTDADAIAAVIGAADTVLLLAESAGELLGCCQLERRADHAYFGSFAVRPTGQARGTGSALLAEAERRAQTWGVPRVELTVIAQRPELIAWYARRGYTATGEQRPFPYGDERFGVPRRDDLVFTVLDKALAVTRP